MTPEAGSVGEHHAGRFDPGPLVESSGGWLLGVGSSGDLIDVDDQGRALGVRWRNRAAPPRLEEPAALWIDDEGWWALGNDSANILRGEGASVSLEAERIHYAHALIRDDEGRIVVGRSPRFAGDAIIVVYEGGEAEPEALVHAPTLDEATALLGDGDRVWVAVWTTGEVVAVDLRSGEIGESLGLFDRPRALAWGNRGEVLVLDALGVWAVGDERELVVDGAGFGFGRALVVESVRSP